MRSDENNNNNLMSLFQLINRWHDQFLLKQPMCKSHIYKDAMSEIQTRDPDYYAVNKVYFFPSFVVKELNPNYLSYDDRLAELFFTDYFSLNEIALSPRIFYQMHDIRFEERFIESEPMNSFDDTSIIDVLCLIRKFHQISKKDFGVFSSKHTYPSFMKKLNEWLYGPSLSQFFEQRPELFKKIHAKKISLYNEFSKWFADLELFIIHGDLHNGNIIRTTSGIKFIDFEFCGFGTEEIELAHYFNEFMQWDCLTELIPNNDLIIKYLKVYYSNDENINYEHKLELIKLMQKILHLFWSLWAYRIVGLGLCKNQDQEKYILYAANRFEIIKGI
jgi:thiamine kinase-like enzyme